MLGSGVQLCAATHPLSRAIGSGRDDRREQHFPARACRSPDDADIRSHALRAMQEALRHSFRVLAPQSNDQWHVRVLASGARQRQPKAMSAARHACTVVKRTVRIPCAAASSRLACTSSMNTVTAGLRAKAVRRWR